MFFKTFLFLGIIRTSQMIPLNIKEDPCTKDSDCDPRQYCYLESNLCAPCKPDYCLKLNRHKSDYRQCHRDYADCGKCFPGFKEEIFADGTKRDACVREPALTDSEELDFSSPVLLGIIGLLLSVVFVLVYINIKKNTNVSQPGPENVPLTSSSTNLNNKSTSYLCGPSVPFNPSAPVLETEEPRREAVNIENRITFITESPTQKALQQTPQKSSLEQTPQNTYEVVHEKLADPPAFGRIEKILKEKLVEARPYRDPNYLSTSTLNEEQETENQVDTSEGFTYHDDSTQPSSWTPEANNVEEAAGNSQQNKRPFLDDEDESDSKIKKVCEE